METDSSTQQLLDGQGGTQQQLHYLALELRRINEKLKEHAERNREQHKDNVDRLDELEKVVIKGNGEISLVRKIDRVQTSMDDVLAAVSKLSGVADTISNWKGRLEERTAQNSNRRWQIGDVMVPILTVLLAVAATAMVEHFIRK